MTPIRSQRGYITPGLLGVLAQRRGAPPPPGPYGGLVLYGLGNTASNFVTTTETYSLTTDAVASGTSLSTGRDGPAAASNADVGWFAGGYNGTELKVSNRYTWATAAVASGASLSTHGQYRYGAAAGTSTLALHRSSDSNGNNDGHDRYTYATDSIAASGAAMASQSSLNAAAGNTTYGYFSGGFSFGSAIDRYAYATDTSASSSALTYTAYGVAAAGNASRGLWAGGPGGTTNASEVAYSTGATTTRTSMPSTAFIHSAAGDSVRGLYLGGSGPATLVQSYTWGTDAWAAATSLSTGRVAGAACCETPGGF